MNGLEKYNQNFRDLDGRLIQPDLRIGFVLVPGFTILPLAGFIDTLRHAADESDHSQQVYCKWKILGPSLEPIPSSCGITIPPWEVYGDPGEFDYIVVVGGQTDLIRAVSKQTYGFLNKAEELRIPLVGLCVGVFVLAEAGLLTYQKCAVHPRHLNEFIERYPNIIPIIDELFVIDLNRITCAGGTAAIDLAVSILMNHLGETQARKGLSHMMVDQHRENLHTPRHPYDELDHCQDLRIKDAVALMKKNLTFPFGVKDLASKLGCSQRQLERAFQKHAQISPAKFWRQLRIKRARWYLLNTNMNITRIAFDCGFSDCAHFTNLFTQIYGESPSRFRSVRLQAAQSTR